MDNGTGKAQKLPLTGREVIAPLPDFIVKTLFQFADKPVGVDILTGLPNFLVGHIVLAQHDIAADIAGEQEHILQHLTEVLPQGGNLDLLDVDAVDEDLTLLNVVVTADEAQNRGFKTISGLDMLIYQAERAIEIWTGKTPDVNIMKIAALEALH